MSVGACRDGAAGRDDGPLSFVYGVGASSRGGEEVSEKLDSAPSSLFLRSIVRPKYVVHFPTTTKPDELHIADLPPEAMPKAKAKAAPGLVAVVIVSKFVDHLLLCRQELRCARQGFPIARSALCDWLAYAEKTSPCEAHEAVARIKQLYAVEHEANDLDAPSRATLR